MAPDALRPAGRAPGLRSVDVGVAVQDAAQLHVGALRRQQGAHGADRRIQPRPAARVAGAGGHCLRRAQPGHAAAVPHRQAACRHRRRRRGAEAIRRAVRGARPGGLHRRRAGAGQGPRQVRRRLAAAGRRDRRLQDVYRKARRPRGQARRDVPLRRDDRAAAGRRRPHRRRQDQRRHAHRRCLCRGARQLFADAVAQGRHFGAGLSDQGLFDHRADHRRRRRTGIDRDGRDLQGGDHPARRRASASAAPPRSPATI